jgi:predicted ATP-grasp superfamily ATP-dependent carboligase
MRILLLNAFSRNSLAALHALPPGVGIDAGTTCAQPVRPWLRRFRNRRLRHLFFYPDPRLNSEGFRDAVIDAVKRFGSDGVIATGTVATDALSFYKAEIAGGTGTHVLVDDFATLGRLTDKRHIFDICGEAGVPMPKTALVASVDNVADVIQTRGMRCPVLIKPRSAYAAMGVRRFEDEGEIRRFLASGEVPAYRKYGSFVVQENIAGRLHDVTLCAHRGEILCMLSQERLVTLYDFGGGGIINRTTDVAVIKDYAERIVRHVSFSGIALFDFIRDADGRFYLLECNPKIWGTTHLTIQAGLNVVQRLIDSQMFGRNLQRDENYEVGLVCKWLFPDCMAHWFTPPLRPDRFLRRVAATFRHYPGSRTINNLHPGDALHWIGILMSKSQ